MPGLVVLFGTRRQGRRRNHRRGEIVWLASFPRSGNTFLRIVLNRLYGLGHPTV